MGLQGAAAVTPTVSGLIGNDTVINLAELYDTPNSGTSKTLSVNSYTINDGNAGNNYALTTTVSTTGVITAGPFSKYVLGILGGNTIVAGNSFIATIQAADSFGNTVTNYNGPGQRHHHHQPGRSPDQFAAHLQPQ